MAARLEHEETLLKNSHRPDHIARAEGHRREAIAFEGALAPVITSEDYATFKEIDIQANMDIDSMIFSLGMAKRMSNNSIILQVQNLAVHPTMCHAG